MSRISKCLRTVGICTIGDKLFHLISLGNISFVQCYYDASIVNKTIAFVHLIAEALNNQNIAFLNKMVHDIVQMPLCKTESTCLLSHDKM